MVLPSPIWRLALPMYNTTPVVDLLWQQVLHAVMGSLRERGWEDNFRIETDPGEVIAFWRSDDLLLSQTCGYPLQTALGDAVQVLAAPEFDLPGCEGVMHRSFLLVPAHGARTLEDLRGRRAAVNQPHSNTGMNALRHSVAPLAREGRFFGDVLWSGGHLASMRMLREGQADVAAIDNVTYALAALHAPECVQGLRVLHASHPTPGLPLIATSRLGAEQADMLRQVLLTLGAREAALFARLGLRRFVPIERKDYGVVLRLEQEAAAQGYPAIA